MGKIKRQFRFDFTYVGLLVGYSFALLSMTVSLLPRAWAVQGLITGATFVFGYGVGNLLGNLYRYFEFPELDKGKKKTVKKVSLWGGLALLVFYLAKTVEWNNAARELIGAETVDGTHAVRVVLISIFIAFLILVISRFVAGTVKTVYRWTLRVMPIKVARVVGGTLGVLLVVFILNGVLLSTVMSGVNNAFSLRDSTTDEGFYQPESNLRSGGSESLVEWDELGRQGRKFTAGGPTVDEINQFSGGGALEPIRAYVGLKSADTIAERADLALQELIRMGAFDREVMVVATTTGTGWLDPNAMNTIEYIHNGDTAIVGLQYSYLPSWISLFVDQQITKDTSIATLRAVHDYWAELEEDERPELYLFGLSLGAYGSQYSSGNLRLVNDQIDGALWAGPPFVSDEWSAITNNRDEGSPAWRAIYDEGRVIRFTNKDNSLYEPTAEWGDVKIVYLQHPTDPITFFSPGLMFNEPDWLQGERGEGVSPDMDWYPAVTFWQVAGDLTMSGAAPAGYGHNFAPNSYIDSWVAITEPENWTQEDTESLKTFYSTNN